MGDSLRTACLDQMRQSLAAESGWTRVHAAEFLVSLDYRAGVRELFERELTQHGAEPEYRLGVWRVLAQLDRHDSRAYQAATARIMRAFLDEKGPDRVHAVEALAKLGYQLGDRPLEAGDPSQWSPEAAQLIRFAEQGPPGGREFAWWLLRVNGMAIAEPRLADSLKATDEVSRFTAAYALRHQPTVTARTCRQLITALTAEPSDSPARVYLLAATLRHWPPDGQQTLRQRYEQELFTYLEQGTPGEQYEASRLLAEIGGPPIDHLVATMHRSDASPDLRASVAHALCRIDRRSTARMSAVDWFVVALYGIGMLSVGFYYLRRTRTASEYLLGARAMRPWAVGLSLFATLLSTLSYLAWPGEMIKNGPMVMMGYAAYPLVYLVVGWLLIPRIMHLEVTSAYEILEKRLGLSVRLLGSTLFLTLRLLWMASIIYWTTAIVLLPAAGLGPAYSSRFAVLLGIVTVVYTSLGGIRAVVATDVIQTLILIAGVLTGLTLITVSMGGVAAWFPDSWPRHWTPPRWWFDVDPQARSTLANAMLGTFAWYVCTAGSDQMAIQRYLATRDVKSARRTLAVSLSTDFAVIVFLGLMGLALLAFFSAHPDKMADGQSVYANADKLFPRFVVVGLPVGMSGLVIAGLLAAAMSSLSSGVNSSAAVISEDFVRRLRRSVDTEAQHVRLVRWISVAVGICVVLLSALIGKVQGNMLEVVYKVVNLFVAPLFSLFFMAIFVPWATPAGTWLGAVAGIATAVLIAFWKDLFGVQGISFLWIMPGSLSLAVVVGCGASWILRRHIGEPRSREAE